jgi:hypothetical protein
MGAEPRIWQNDKNHAVATLGPLIITVWRGRDTYRNWLAESEPVYRHVGAQSSGCCVLIVAEEDAVPPDTAARKEVDEAARRRNNMVVASAVIAYGSAMRVTAVRALSVAINVFGKSTMRVFTDAPPAVAYLADTGSKAKLSVESPATLQLVKQLRVTK